MPFFFVSIGTKVDLGAFTDGTILAVALGVTALATIGKLVGGGLASLGLPGLSGFVAEILVFLGAFSVWPWPTALAAFGIVLTAGYILWMIQRVLFGPPRERFRHISDARFVEAIPLALMVVAIVVVGVYPTILTDVFGAGMVPILGRFG